MKQVQNIDAAGKSLGRVASQAAIILMGKDKPSYERHRITGDSVIIKNASKLALSERKLDGKIYTRYTGYPGGLREDSMRVVIKKKGHAELIRKAVRGMLPTNKLRKKLLERLTVEA